MDVNAFQAQSTRSSRFFIFSICLIFRLICAWLTRTYDNPDEYWQGQEVAHHLVFGHGYLTWEWRERIRSFAHPLVFATVYKFLQLLHLDDTYLIVVAPRYFQASLAALADLATYSLAKRVIGSDIALPILFTTLCSWYNFFMSARTLSNTIEMILTVLALNYWPLPGVVSTAGRQWLKDYRVALTLAIIACVMRPTNGLLWLFLGSQLIIVSPNRTKVIINAIIVCSVVLTINILLDTWLYDDDLVFTPYRFFQVNVVNNISLFYGVHSWHWYLSQGIPFILTTFLPFLGFGLYSIYHSKRLYHRMKTLLYLTAWILIVYSLLPHKEFRFIYPIVPILLILTAYGLQQTAAHYPQSRRLCMLFLLLTQIPMALYLSLWHQRGVMDVMLWLREQQEQQQPHENLLSVGALMPCHSTPWYSVIHKDIDMWFLTCEPPLDQQQATYLDEADQFYVDPIQFIETHQKDRVWPPTHLILFDDLLTSYTALEVYLRQQHGYKECQRFFNSHFHDDPRRKGDVVVFCRD